MNQTTFYARLRAHVAALMLVAALTASCSDSSTGPAAVASVTIVATSTSVDVGANLQLAAQPKDAAGNVLVGRDVTWESSNTDFAQVSNTGLVTGASAGAVTITAASEGKSATLNLTIAGVAALTVTSTTPAADAENIGIEATVQIQFSAAINAASVTSSTVMLEAGGTPVAGALAVSGSTVTFTPTELLTERTTTYTLTVTTGVLTTVGNFLPADVVRTFATAFWDPAFYYRVTNLFQGPTLSLDTFSDTFGCYMGNSGGFTGQFWYFTPAAGYPGYYAMRNQFQGDALALEGADAPARCLLTSPSAPNAYFSGQLWQPVAYGDGFRLQNLYLGVARSLDVIDDGDGTYVPMMVDTGDFSGQMWFFTRVSKR